MLMKKLNDFHFRLVLLDEESHKKVRLSKADEFSSKYYEDVKKLKEIIKEIK